jgi:hypothetical protein
MLHILLLIVALLASPVVLQAQNIAPPSGSGGGLASGDIDTCAEFAAIMTGETGTCGSVVLSADPVFTGSLQIPNGAAPTTDAFGEIAGDNNAWAASRGAIQWFDGTANTYIIGALASDAPANGECIKWNTGGTITWETCGSGSMATDTLWDAAGDLAYGTGSNTGGRLVVGTANQILQVNAGATAPEWTSTPSVTSLTVTGAGVGTVALLEGTAPGAHATANTHNCYIDSTTSRVACHENGGSVKDYVTAADTQTLTGKTIDTASNTLTVPVRKYLPAAGCNNATAGPVWNLPTANAPAAACITGTNTQKGVLDFDQTTDESAQIEILLPSTWTGAIDANVLWLSGTTTGSVAWCIQLISAADAETDDPAYPAQATGNCVSDAAKGTANQLNVAVLTGITATGVAAGELLHIQISRDPNETSTRTDDHAADARLVGVELIYRVTE